MDLHQNARSCPASRVVLVKRVRELGWTVRSAAAAVGMSERRAYVWLARYRAEGEEGLQDRSSRPRRMAHRVPADRLERALVLRRQRRSASEIAGLVGVPRSTVGRWLARHGLGRLRQLGAPEPARRFQKQTPGEPVHLDIKKLGRIGRIGHRITGDRRSRVRGIGWEFVHVAIDDASRLAYVEVLEDERGPTATAFLCRAVDAFTRCGIRVQALLTD
ncbi:MAG TPA: leucine zipper domain-containing protein, partial [Thermoanaerobaculaceae bacterium]|nr:leucine zipper domain-containing protein [Thermoanaerobaculaceae bacterium]